MEPNGETLRSILSRLDTISERTTHSATILETLTGDGGRINRLQEDVDELKMFKAQAEGVKGAFSWLQALMLAGSTALVEWLLHRK